VQKSACVPMIDGRAADVDFWAGGTNLQALAHPLHDLREIGGCVGLRERRLYGSLPIYRQLSGWRLRTFQHLPLDLPSALYRHQVCATQDEASNPRIDRSLWVLACLFSAHEPCSRKLITANAAPSGSSRTANRPTPGICCVATRTRPPRSRARATSASTSPTLT